MKHLMVLESPAEARRFVHGLWKTELFRNSPYVANWVARFAEHPTTFAEMSDEQLETPHFGTYFGMTYLRHYDSPAVSDLYYLHELVHASLFQYQRDQLFTSWYRKLTSIELAASLETEGYVYFRIPGLRDISFEDEIWADRFLGAQRRLGEGIFDIMRQDRYKAMQHPDPMDWCEQQISAYARQNFQWAATWKLEIDHGGLRRAAYLHVEAHMAALRAGETSMREHAAWLEGFGEIPFRDQARLFAPIYWDNKLSYKLKKL